MGDRHWSVDAACVFVGSTEYVLSSGRLGLAVDGG